MGIKYAGFWIRFVAVLIDTLFNMFLFFMVGLVLGFLSPKLGLNNLAILQSKNVLGIPINNPAQLIQMFASYLFNFLYYGVIQGLYGVTIGKKMMGLCVVNKETKPPGILRGIWRLFMQVPSLLLLGIGYFMAAFGKEKRALHDFLSGTHVVYEDSIEASE